MRIGLTGLSRSSLLLAMLPLVRPWREIGPRAKAKPHQLQEGTHKFVYRLTIALSIEAKEEMDSESRQSAQRGASSVGWTHGKRSSGKNCFVGLSREASS
jgi:hypothetical protein